MRPVLTFVSLTVIALLLAACTGDPGASDPDGVDPGGDDAGTASSTPAVVTEVEGTSELESDPFVQAARAADTGYVMAVNALDFSIPEFTETHSVGDQKVFFDFFVDEFVTDGAPVVMFPGPSIWLPLSVEETEGGEGADITVCNASVDWAVSAEFPEPAYDLTNGTILHVSVTTDDRGNLVWASEAELGEACDATGAPVQRFDPGPEVPDGPISIEDVTPPSS